MEIATEVKKYTNVWGAGGLSEPKRGGRGEKKLSQGYTKTESQTTAEMQYIRRVTGTTRKL